MFKIARLHSLGLYDIPFFVKLRVKLHRKGQKLGYIPSTKMITDEGYYPYNISDLRDISKKPFSFMRWFYEDFAYDLEQLILSPIVIPYKIFRFFEIKWKWYVTERLNIIKIGKAGYYDADQRLELAIIKIVEDFLKYDAPRIEDKKLLNSIQESYDFLIGKSPKSKELNKAISNAYDVDTKESYADAFLLETYKEKLKTKHFTNILKHRNKLWS